MKLFLLKILMFAFVLSAFSQVRQNNFCYQEKYSGDDKVFEKMEIYPSYNGGLDKLNQFVLQNIAIDKIASSITENIRFLSDTLQLRFIISKDKKMSNLLMPKAQNNPIKDELQRVLILSSCNWTPGDASGRYLTGWFQKQLVFLMDRRGSFLSLKIEWLEPSYGATADNSSFKQ